MLFVPAGVRDDHHGPADAGAGRARRDGVRAPAHVPRIYHTHHRRLVLRYVLLSTSRTRFPHASFVFYLCLLGSFVFFVSCEHIHLLKKKQSKHFPLSPAADKLQPPLDQREVEDFLFSELVPKPLTRESAESLVSRFVTNMTINTLDQQLCFVDSLPSSRLPQQQQRQQGQQQKKGEAAQESDGAKDEDQDEEEEQECV